MRYASIKAGLGFAAWAVGVAALTKLVTSFANELSGDCDEDDDGDDGRLLVVVLDKAVLLLTISESCCSCCCRITRSSSAIDLAPFGESDREANASPNSEASVPI